MSRPAWKQQTLDVWRSNNSSAYQETLPAPPPPASPQQLSRASYRRQKSDPISEHEIKRHKPTKRKRRRAESDSPGETGKDSEYHEESEHLTRLSTSPAPSIISNRNRRTSLPREAKRIRESSTPPPPPEQAEGDSEVAYTLLSLSKMHAVFPLLQLLCLSLFLVSLTLALRSPDFPWPEQPPPQLPAKISAFNFVHEYLLGGRMPPNSEESPAGNAVRLCKQMQVVRDMTGHGHAVYGMEMSRHRYAQGDLHITCTLIPYMEIKFSSFSSFLPLFCCVCAFVRNIHHERSLLALNGDKGHVTIYATDGPTNPLATWTAGER